MVQIGNYIITQEDNRLIISLPQTIETLTNTIVPIEDRKVKLTLEELAVILEVVKKMYKK